MKRHLGILFLFSLIVTLLLASPQVYRSIESATESDILTAQLTSTDKNAQDALIKKEFFSPSTSRPSIAVRVLPLFLSPISTFKLLEFDPALLAALSFYKIFDRYSKDCKIYKWRNIRI